MRRDEERADGRLPGRAPWVRPQEREAEALRAPLVTDADRLTPDTAARLQGLAGNAALTRIVGGRTSAPAAAAGSAPVQRVTEDELHRHPPGPSLRVRGPRKSRKKDKTPNQVEDPALWRNIEAAAGGRPGLDVEKQRLEISEDPQTLREQDIGLRNQLSAAAFRRPDRDPQAVQHNEVLEDMGRADPHSAPYWQRQDARDRKLLADTEALGRARPADGADPAFAEEVDGKLQQIGEVVDGIEGLLADHDGVIVGGAHRGSPTWRFLTDNLARLKAAGVTTVYLESLRDDSYQAEADRYLNTGELSDRLRKFMQNYDMVNDLTAAGLTQFLPEARRQGIRVRGIDGRPARQVPGPELKHRRAAAMNTYAEQVVREDRAGGRGEPGKYLMEIGAAHGAAHRSASGEAVRAGEAEIPPVFPGLSELLNVPAVKYTDPADPENSRLSRIRPAPAP
ncbi:membrane-targeted effector domain-containing toxin [Streptomyces koyangensis]